MKALIFAAGLGTRLFPLTQNKPKALCEIAGKTLLQYAIEKVSHAGYNDLIINIHHFGDQIIDFLKSHHNFGLNIVVSDEREQLLDTGGGIVKASWFLDGPEPFLVYNVDVFSTIDLDQLLQVHKQNGALATLAVRERVTSRYLMFDKQMQLSGWRNTKSNEQIIARKSNEANLYAFSGIQLVNPEIFKLILEKGSFPLIPLYLRLASEQSIYGFLDESNLWMDLGKPDQLIEAERYINDNNSYF
ncbi:MAG: nucleotidyltransferase family protein [Bacteroidia bacterium]|nr:nucleotidyltransferase family protein [Bacteroidia bacterium]